MSRPDPTPEQIEDFLSLYRSGMKRNEAARTMNVGPVDELCEQGMLVDDAEAKLKREGKWFTGSGFRSLYKRDPEFQKAFDEAEEEHEDNYEERVRAEYVGRAMRGSDRLLDNLGQAVLPELRKLKESSVEHNVKVQIGRYFDLTQLGQLPCPHCGGVIDELDTLQTLVEKASKQKELPSGRAA